MGGTVLGSTIHFACYQPLAGADYPAVIRVLVEAGADVRAVAPFPTGDPAIDGALRGPR